MSYRKMLMILLLGALPPLLPAQSLNWNPPSTASPVPLCCVGMAYDAVRGETVLFGGFEGANSATPFVAHSETWTLGASGWTLKNPAASPSARGAVAMAFDPQNRVTVLFGGTSNSSGGGGLAAYFHDTWVWDGTIWNQVVVSGMSPSARLTAAQGMAYDANNGNLVLFGGLTSGVTAGDLNGLNDTWTLQLSQPTPGAWVGTWTAITTTTAPSARRAALSRYKGFVILYGGDAWAHGMTNPTPFNDVWKWTGSNWKRLIPNGASDSPAPQVLPSLTWDSATQQAILFAGNNSNQDTWALSIASGAASWTQLFPGTTDTVVGRFDFGMVYDPGAGIEVFGGFAGCCAYNDLWFLK
jgi:hypothetical protein